MQNESLIADLAKKVKNYKPSANVGSLLAQVPVTLLVGISGSGKDATKEAVLKKYGNQYHDVVTHTTRAPRENNGRMEQNGVEYHFIDFPTANYMLDNKGYIEANIFSKNVYGMSVAEIEMAHEEGRIPITDLDVNGVDNLVRLSNSVVPIFILPPSPEIWWQRFLGRYGQTGSDPQDIKRRKLTAIDELKLARDNDYFHFVINDDLQQCAEAVNRLARGDIPTSETRTPQALSIVNDLIDSLRGNGELI